MDNLIIACGDSNTAGYEAIGGHKKPFPEKSWSAKLGKILNTEVVNISQPGVGNDVIFTKSLHRILSGDISKTTNVLFLIMWSDAFRYSVITPDTQETLHLTSNASKNNLYTNSTYKDDIVNYNKLSILLRNDVLDSLYTLQKYYSLYNILTSFGISCLFCNGITSLFKHFNPPVSEIQYQYNILLDEYVNKIPFKHLGLFESTETFHNYSKDVKKYSFAENSLTNHWGENAHQAYAEYIYENNKEYLDNVLT